MDVKTMTDYAEQFCSKNFNINLMIPIRISSRMKNKLGAFVVKTKNRKIISEEIVISKSFVDNNSKAVILDVLYHECVHYALYKLGLPYKDQDQYFKDTLKELGIRKSRSYTYKGIEHIYFCPTCRYQFTKRMKGYEKRYICRTCHSKFKYVGESSKKLGIV